MNTKKIEKWLLLEQTGELTPKQLRHLNRELEESEKARNLRAELGVLSGSVHKTDVALPPWMVTKINGRLRAERRPSTGFSKVWKPALALAACLLVVTGILNFHEGQIASAPAAVMASVGVDVWNVPYEEDLSQLERLIVAISNDPVDIMEM